MEKQATSSYESPRLTTYGELSTITKGVIVGSTDATVNFKA